MMAKNSGNAIDVGEWKSISSKSDEGIPPLGDNTFTCSCSPCKAVFRETVHWTSMKKEENPNIPIKLGDRVLVRQSHPGIVRYIGDLDSKYTDDQIYVGVKLDDPVGEHDGVYCNKRFFECPDMHGTIVPIEQVHILTPRDGREIKVQTRFFSMPEMADLESLICIAHNPEKSISQTLSEGQLTSGSITGKNTPLKNSEFVEDLEVQMKPSLNDKGINRSAVFICDNPGSIAASIAHTKSGSDIQAILLKKLSSGGSVDSKDEGGKEFVATNVTQKENKRVKSASITSKNSLSTQRRYSISATSIRRPQYSQGSLVSSKSASSTISTKKSGGHSISNQVASNHPTKDEQLQVTKQDNKEPSSPVIPDGPKLAFIAEPQSIGTSQSDPSANQSLNLVDKVITIDQRDSLTWRLLSCLPINKSATPLPDNEMINAKQFGELMKERGDDDKAWIMSHTIQKLQTAQQRGKIEVEWQQYLDQLEESGQFTEKFRAIKALREEVGKYHQMNNELEDEYRSLTDSHSSCHQELEKIKDEIKIIHKDTQNLMDELRSHPLFELMCDSLTVYGYDWRDIEAHFD